MPAYANLPICLASCIIIWTCSFCCHLSLAFVPGVQPFLSWNGFLSLILCILFFFFFFNSLYSWLLWCCLLSGSFFPDFPHISFQFLDPYFPPVLGFLLSTVEQYQPEMPLWRASSNFWLLNSQVDWLKCLSLLKFMVCSLPPYQKVLNFWYCISF